MDQIASFKEKIGSIANLEMKAGGVLFVGVPVPCHDRGLDIERSSRRESHLGPRGTRRIERLIYGAEKITERVTHRLDEP